MRMRWKNRIEELAKSIKSAGGDKMSDLDDFRLRGSISEPLKQEDNKNNPSSTLVKDEDIDLKSDKRINPDKRYQVFPNDYLNNPPNGDLALPPAKPSKIKKLIENAKIVLTPFSYYYNSMDIGDAFYFTQRFYAPILVGFMAFVVLFILVIALLIAVIVAINTMKINIHKTSYSFINLASANALTFNEAFTDKDLQPVESVIGEINGYFDEIISAILLGLVIALAFACLFFVASVISSLTTFRRHIIKLRIGKWTLPVDRETFAVKESVGYSGIVISNFMIGFVIVLVTLGLVFMLLCLKLFWEFIIENYMIFVVILTPVVIEKVVMIVMQSATLRPGFVTWRPYFPIFVIKNRIFSIIDLFLTYLGIIGGFVSGIVRYVVSVLVLAFGITRVDKPMLPQWILKFLWLDSANSCYYSAILMYHNHNDPFFITMARLLCIF